jgi:hypothetical protein
MATIIDNEYFLNGWLFIPNNKNINAAPVGSPSITSDLDLFRIEYERELLINAFGVTLYNGLQTALLDLPASDQKWQDLVNGKDYAINSKTKRWNGLRGANQQSLIAFYVYCQYLRNDNSTYLTTGISQSTANNAERSDPSPKFVKSWNRFLNQYQGKGYNNSYPTVIYNRSGMVGLDYYGSDNVESNLFQYLTDQNELTPTDFPDFEFKFYESYNTFGI